MTIEKNKKKRRYSPKIQVIVSSEEKEKITEAASWAGLSASAYLRELGLGTKPTSIFDLDVTEKLVKLAADQGRYGGLLKMWLTNDERLAMFSQKELSTAIFSSLERVEKIQTEILELLKYRKILAAKIR